MSAAEAEIEDKRADVDAAQDDVNLAQSELAQRENGVIGAESYKDNLDFDAAASKAVLDMWEQNKQITESDLENALDDLNTADQDVQSVAQILLRVASLDQAEQDKQNTEADLENAMDDVAMANQDV